MRGTAEPELRGEARVLDMADRMRGCGGGSPATLYGACVAEFRKGHVAFDQVTPLYRHACVHALLVVPRDRRRFDVCPDCGADLLLSAAAAEAEGLLGARDGAD